MGTTARTIVGALLVASRHWRTAVNVGLGEGAVPGTYTPSATVGFLRALTITPVATWS